MDAVWLINAWISLHARRLLHYYCEVSVRARMRCWHYSLPVHAPVPTVGPEVNGVQYMVYLMDPQLCHLPRTECLTFWHWRRHRCRGPPPMTSDIFTTVNQASLSWSVALDIWHLHYRAPGIADSRPLLRSDIFITVHQASLTWSAALDIFTTVHQASLSWSAALDIWHLHYCAPGIADLVGRSWHLHYRVLAPMHVTHDLIYS